MAQAGDSGRFKGSFDVPEGPVNVEVIKEGTSAMQYMIEYSISPQNRDVAQARFLETGGLPPAGATMLGRWHRLSGLSGYVLCESGDAVAIGKWMQAWTDVLTFEVVPIGDDAQFTEVIGG
jgi:Protein of unknown function (DUF3303)